MFWFGIKVIQSIRNRFKKGFDMLKMALPAHSHWRYMIFLFAAVAILSLLVGWLAKKKWTKGSKLLALSYPIMLDIQMLFGMLLWVLEQRWTGADPLSSWEHPVTMIIALALAHIGFKKTKSEQASDQEKYQKCFIFYFLSIVFMVLGVIRVTS